MRSTCSLYIDAGYLLASAATRVTGTSLRSGIHVNYDSLIAALVSTVEERSGLPLLRVHWYDSAHKGIPDTQQERIGELARVKLRLGRFGVEGQQKGVDLRIGLDLVAHARNDTSDIFFLVSGDDDLTEAVEEAQAHGVQVVVLAMPNADDKPHGLNRHLVRAADEVELVDGGIIDGCAMKVEVPRPSPKPIAAPTPVARQPDGAPARSGPSPLDVATRAHSNESLPPVRPSAQIAYSGSTGGLSVVHPHYGDVEDYETEIDAIVDRVLASFIKSANVDDRRDLDRARPSIPREIDRALLLDASDALDVYDISESIRFRLRERFWEKYDRL